MTAVLLAFALTATLLILAPGPDSMLVMRNTLRGGQRAGMDHRLRDHVGAGGLGGGRRPRAVGVAAGQPRRLRRPPARRRRLPDLARGHEPAVAPRARRTRPRAERPTGGAGEPTGRPAGRAGGWRVYLNGLLSNLFNPKIGVFFVAFLPGFIPARASAAAFSLVLGLWFIVETGAWLVTLTWMVARGVGWLRGSAAQRWAERVTGVVLIGFGLRLAAETR